MKPTEFVNTALENLHRNTNIWCAWEAYKQAHNNNIDGIVTLSINNKTYRINTEVKKTLRNHQIYQIKELAKAHQPFLLVAEQLFPNIKEELRKNDIAYLEANGNIYLKEPGIYLWIDNQKAIPIEKELINRAFTKTGLKVVFHFLLNEEIVNYPYRHIAEMTGVGLGNVPNVINGLQQAGFLLKLSADKHRLVNKKELLEKWMVAYEEKLKPLLHIGNFRCLTEADYSHWKEWHLEEGNTFWGAEPAAEILTNYLRPEILTVYTDESKSDLIKHYRWIPDDKGKIKVYRKFWNYSSINSNTVDPILVYADLMNTGDGRCIETAKKIFDNYGFADKF